MEEEARSQKIPKQLNRETLEGFFEHVPEICQNFSAWDYSPNC
jgi:hypothetical protein